MLLEEYILLHLFLFEGGYYQYYRINGIYYIDNPWDHLEIIFSKLEEKSKVEGEYVNRSLYYPLLAKEKYAIAEHTKKLH